MYVCTQAHDNACLNGGDSVHWGQTGPLATLS